MKKKIELEIVGTTPEAVDLPSVPDLPAPRAVQPRSVRVQKGGGAVVSYVAQIEALQDVPQGGGGHQLLLRATTALALSEMEGEEAPGWEEKLVQAVQKFWTKKPLAESAVRELVQTAKDRAAASRRPLVMGEKGPLLTAGNAGITLSEGRWEGVLGFNEFSERVVWLKTPEELPHVKVGADLKDSDLTGIVQVLGTRYHKKFSREDALHGARAAAERHPFHPVRDYLLQVLPWDGKPRLRSWLSDFCGADERDITSKIGRWFLISAVARVMNPGCFVKYVLLLQGRQDIGKSKAAMILAGGPDWFTDHISDLKNKDSELELWGKWIVEASELTTFSRAEVEAIKSYISRTHSNIRSPYERVTQMRPRQCVFIGTTNNEAPLTDTTGNVRFWPVRVDQMSEADVAGLLAARDQLWAEAVTAYLEGEAYWARTEEDKTSLVERQAEATVEDPWEDALRTWWKNRSKKSPALLSPGMGDPPYTSTELLAGVMGVEVGRQGQKEWNRMGAVLRRMGWKREAKKPNESRRWSPPSTWCPPSLEEGDQLN